MEAGAESSSLLIAMVSVGGFYQNTRWPQWSPVVVVSQEVNAAWGALVTVVLSGTPLFLGAVRQDDEQNLTPMSVIPSEQDGEKDLTPTSVEHSAGQPESFISETTASSDI